MGNLRRTVIAIFIILIIAMAVIIYALPSVTGMLVETYTAEYGELSIYDDTTGYFLRNEAVYASDSGGDINRLSGEGDLLRPGTVVIGMTGAYAGETDSTATTGTDAEDATANSGTDAAATTDASAASNAEAASSSDAQSAGVPADRITEIKNKLSSRLVKTSDYRIETGGIVSFFVDGYEYTMFPDRASMIRKSELDEVKQSEVEEIGDSVRPGYPVFKVISNDGWELIAYIPKEHLDQYEEGQGVDVTFFEKTESDTSEFADLSSKDPLFNKVTMIVYSATTEGDYGKLVLHSSRFFGGLGKYRVAYCRIVSQDVRGLIIENSSIVEVDGVTGVYVKNKKGKYDFIPVLIYGSNDTVTVIADTYFYNSKGEYTKTVDPFDDVRRNPNVDQDTEEEEEN